jgi:hypothetical protein
MNGTHFDMKRQKDRVELRPELAQPGRSPIRGFATGVSAKADIGAAALTQLSFTST